MLLTLWVIVLATWVTIGVFTWVVPAAYTRQLRVAASGSDSAPG